MATLKLAKDFNLDSDAVNRRYAILGMTGSGKSNTGSVMVEQFLGIGAQTVILDNDGSWYSLRLSADGKKKAFDIPVFGGLHGDIPLNHLSGSIVADVIVDRNISAVIDVSMFRKGQRTQFATDFAEQLFHRKKSNRSAMCLVVEEAQDYIPQRVQKGQERMLGAFEDLGKAGRKYGIGLMVLSQRPQSINKEVLNQAEVLFIHQTYGPQERQALADWVVEKGMDKKIVDELASLEIGEAYVWSPRWLKTIRRIKMNLKHTLDAAATPHFGEKSVSYSLAPVDLEKIKIDMAETIKAQEEKDPKVLQRRIAALAKELENAKRAAPVQNSIDPNIYIEKYFDKNVLPFLQKNKNMIQDSIARISALANDFESKLAKELNTLQKNIPEIQQLKTDRLDVPLQKIDRLPVKPAVNIQNITSNLPTGELECLKLAMGGFARSQYPAMTGYKPSSVDAYIQRLCKKGLIEDGKKPIITDAGREIINEDFLSIQDVNSPELWKSKLPIGEWAVLETLIDNPNGCSKQALYGFLTKYNQNSIDAYLQRLVKKELITFDSTAYFANEVFHR